MNEIQKVRKELTHLIVNKVKPLRQQLDDLLNKEAEKLCPFKLDEIITLDNGKMGKIAEIKYYSMDYDFYEDEESRDFSEMFLDKLDDIQYKYSYSLDDKKFSITWEISGYRMIKNNTEVGKTRFVGINPAHFIIDKANKSISRKNLQDYITDPDHLLFMDDLK